MGTKKIIFFPPLAFGRARGSGDGGGVQDHRDGLGKGGSLLRLAAEKSSLGKWPKHPRWVLV